MAVADSGAGSKSVEMARNDFEWLVKNILFRYRDTQIDVRSSSEYRQLMEEVITIYAMARYATTIHCSGS